MHTNVDLFFCPSLILKDKNNKTDNCFDDTLLKVNPVY